MPHSSQVITALRALAQYYAQLDRPPRHVRAETHGTHLVVVYRDIRSLLYYAHKKRVTVPLSPALAAAGPAGLDAAIVAAGDEVRAKLPTQVPVLYSPSLPVLVPATLGYAVWYALRSLPRVTSRFPRAWTKVDVLVQGTLKLHVLEAVVMFGYNLWVRKAPLTIAALWALNQLCVGVVSFPAYWKLNPSSLALRPTRGLGK